MSTTRYIEVDSRFRNRNKWSNPAEFEVPISQSGRKGAVDALDPISNAASGGFSWRINSFDSLTPSATITVTINSPPVVTSSSGLIVFVTGTPGELQLLTDYYAGAVLELGTTPTTRSRILEYKYLNNDQARITVSDNISSAAGVGTSWDIKDPTDFTPAWNPLLFIPGTILPNNFLVNRIIYNETQDECRPLGEYHTPTSIVPIITSGSAISTKTSGPITSWTLTDVVSIRSEKPTFKTQLNGDPANISTTTSFNLPTALPSPSVGGFLEKMFMPPGPSRTIAVVAGTTSEIISLNASDDPGGGSGNDNFYTGCFIRITSGAAIGQIRLIVSYVQSSNVIVVEPGFAVASSPLAGDSYTLFCESEARRIVKYVDLRANAVASGANTVIFPAIDNNGNVFSNDNGFYENLYVVSTGGPDIRLITNYTVTNVGGVITRTATVNTPWTVAPGPFTITSGIVSPGFTSSISQSSPPPGPNNIAQEFFYLPFNQDSFNPFVYTGSLVSQQDMVCYEVTLLNLVLPNITLDTAYGGLISFYPYIYVQIQNVSAAGAKLKNIIYSNNPAATNMTFRCPVKDVPNPATSRFIKLDGNGMVQTIKFKPNDNLQFSVHMATGELFKTILGDSSSPNPPDPLVQISASFAIRRI
jgi:hypothetical protein